MLAQVSAKSKMTWPTDIEGLQRLTEELLKHLPETQRGPVEHAMRCWAILEQLGGDSAEVNKARETAIADHPRNG